MGLNIYVVVNVCVCTASGDIEYAGIGPQVIPMNAVRGAKYQVLIL